MHEVRPQSRPRDAAAAAAGRNAGSATLSAVIFSAIISIGLAGVLPMLLSDWKHNSRTSAQEAAFTLAESGIEEAIWAVTEYAADADAWEDAGWQESANEKYWYRQWKLADYSDSLGTDYELDEGRQGVFRVIVEKVESTNIHIVSQGSVTGGANVPADMEVARYIETQFRRPNPFGYGLIARRGMSLNGQPFFDSYDSRVFPHDYSYGVNSGQKANVGGPSVNLSDFKITNPRIFGNPVAGSPDGEPHPFDGKNFTGELIYDFQMDFPEVVAPNTTGWKTSL
ncbi:MAG: hypothetical protein ACLFVC_09275 [Opitutales bacterium]